MQKNLSSFAPVAPAWSLQIQSGVSDSEEDSEEEGEEEEEAGRSGRTE